MRSSLLKAGSPACAIQLLDLPENEIHVWTTRTEVPVEETRLRSYVALLNAQEHERWRRFYFERDRVRYLVTRALVRTTLSRYREVSPEDWDYATGPYGRPFIAAPAAVCGSLCFNISHTRGLTVCAVTGGRNVGIDVENRSRGQVSLSLADRFFASAESSALRQLPAQSQRDAFFELWTLKESYIKAIGLGLHMPLDEFAFDLATERNISVRFEEHLHDDAMHWHFFLFAASACHVMAVCAERRESEATPKIVTRSVVPLEAACRVDRPVLLRQSNE
jgi:4'-phosphopantetheinyl transferase